MSHEALFERYFTGALDEREATQLKAVLAEPEGRQQFVAHLQERSALMEATRRLDSEPARPTRARRPARQAAVAALAASILIMVAVGIRLTRQAPAPPAPAPTSPPTLATITQCSGAVVLLRDGADRPVAQGDRLRSGDRLRTSGGGSAILQLTGERTSLDLGDAVALTITAELLRLDAGRLEAEVAPRTERPLTFRTPHARAIVLGTRLLLTVDGQRTRLDVSRGRVRLTHATRAESVVVGAGYYGEARSGQPLVHRPRHTVATPVITPAGGAFDGSRTVTLRTRTPGATIRYSTDGLPPGASAPIYDGPLTLRRSTMLRARAYKRGLAPSAEAVARFRLRPPDPVVLPLAEAPVFDPRGRRFVGEVRVELSSDTPGAVVRYTLDGSEPTARATRYTQRIRLQRTTTIRARTFADRHRPSPVSQATFLVSPPPKKPVTPPPKPVVHTVRAPTAAPAGGTFVNGTEVRLGCQTAGAVIRYTLDGSEPTERSRRFEREALEITQTTRLRMRAYREGFRPSKIVSLAFTIKKVARVATPRIHPDGGRHRRRVKISLSVATPGAVIRYALSGPVSERSPVYTRPIKLRETAVIHVRAYRRGMLPSKTAEARFVIER